MSGWLFIVLRFVLWDLRFGWLEVDDLVVVWVLSVLKDRL